MNVELSVKNLYRYILLSESKHCAFNVVSQNNDHKSNNDSIAGLHNFLSIAK